MECRIKESTGKAILKVFRTEGRIGKKKNRKKSAIYWENFRKLVKRLEIRDSSNKNDSNPMNKEASMQKFYDPIQKSTMKNANSLSIGFYGNYLYFHILNWKTKYFFLSQFTR